MNAIYESHPDLFRFDVRSSVKNFSIEEAVAENLIHIYFKPMLHTRDSSEEVLVALWDNKTISKTTESTSINASEPLSSMEASRAEEGISNKAKTWEPDDLIIYGKILQAWRRARWEEAFAYFFD